MGLQKKERDKTNSLWGFFFSTSHPPVYVRQSQHQSVKTPRCSHDVSGSFLTLSNGRLPLCCYLSAAAFTSLPVNKVVQFIPACLHSQELHLQAFHFSVGCVWVCVCVGVCVCVYVCCRIFTVSLLKRGNTHFLSLSERHNSQSVIMKFRLHAHCCTLNCKFDL